ncbi:MAG: hypothetical protein E7H88_06010, partial [Clostridium perfringens]|nr:hypothetical protein [Clostridium perfringens]
MNNTTQTPKNYIVKIVERKDVKNFIEKYHYSHNINGLMSNYCFGLFDNNIMIGAMIYGKMAMANQWKKYSVNNNSNQSTIIELRRLV